MRPSMLSIALLAVVVNPGDLFVSDCAGGPARITHVDRKTGKQTVVSNGAISTAAGGEDALRDPSGLALDAQGNLLVADGGSVGIGPGGPSFSPGSIVRIDPASGRQTTVSSNPISQAAGGAQLFSALPDLDVASDGTIYAIVSGVSPGAVVGVNPSTGAQTLASDDATSTGQGGDAGLSAPSGIAITGSQAYVSTLAGVVRVDLQTGVQKIVSTNAISQAAGGEQDFTGPTGITLESAGSALVTD
ncbi:MAG: hypothetical protein QOG62_678, partial [Thermoleophilaceae bacterium]|nr:hypothetical protein [Thermoleophilaceae bacterium]